MEKGCFGLFMWPHNKPRTHLLTLRTALEMAYNLFHIDRCGKGFVFHLFLNFVGSQHDVWLLRNFWSTPLCKADPILVIS